MRWTQAVSLDERTEADGKDVWSWRPDAGAKFARNKFRAATGARTPGPRGERDISRNTIAWGMPDVSGASAVNTRVHTPTTKRTRGCGCIGHPAFPAPSYCRGWFEQQTRALFAPRECEGVFSVIASEAKQSILPFCGEMDCFASLAMTAAPESTFTTVIAR